MTNQAIVHHTTITTLTFVSKPAEETRKALVAAGYQFNANSGQWYRREVTPGLISEAQAAHEAGLEESGDQTAVKKAA